MPYKHEIQRLASLPVTGDFGRLESRTIYVLNDVLSAIGTGEDHWDGRSPSTPVKTLAKALELVSAKRFSNSEDNRWTVHLLGETQIIDETVTVADYTNIIGPRATISSKAAGVRLTIGDHCNIEVDRLHAEVGTVINAGATLDTSVSTIKARLVNQEGSGLIADFTSASTYIMEIGHLHHGLAASGAYCIQTTGRLQVKVGRCQMRSASPTFKTVLDATTDYAIFDINHADSNSANSSILLENSNTAATAATILKVLCCDVHVILDATQGTNTSVTNMMIGVEGPTYANTISQDGGATVNRMDLDVV